MQKKKNITTYCVFSTPCQGGGKEQICLPSSCGIHLSGSPSSSSLSYLPEGRRQVQSVEKRQAPRELLKPAASAGWEVLKDIYLALRCCTIPQAAPARQFLPLSSPGFLFRNKSRRTCTPRATCNARRTAAITEKLVTRPSSGAQLLKFRSSAGWRSAGPASNLTPKTVCNRSLQLSHRPLLPQTLLTLYSSYSSVPLLLWRALHF